MRLRLGIMKEIFQMAFDSIRTHKLRPFLTLLGIMIGVMTVIGMVSIIQGINRTFLGALESIGSDLIFVGKYDPIQLGHRSEEERQRKDLTIEEKKTFIVVTHDESLLNFATKKFTLRDGLLHKIEKGNHRAKKYVD